MEKILLVPAALIIGFIVVAVFGTFIYDYTVAPVRRMFRKRRRHRRGGMP